MVVYKQRAAGLRVAMYNPIYLIEEEEVAPRGPRFDPMHQRALRGAVAKHQRCRCGVSRAMLLKGLFSCIVICVLLATYNACVWCVLGILLVSVVTINCLPGMPVVFLACVCVLLYNVTDYKSASVRVEVRSAPR